MRRFGPVLVYLLTAFQAGVPAPARESRDETAVRGIVRTYLEARERRDPAAIGALFVTDADQLTSAGDWRTGRDEIVRGTLASSASNSGTRTITIEKLRFPTPGVAIADGRYELAGSQEGPRRMWTTFVMVRASGDDWKIAAIRNMLPAAPAVK